MINIDDITFEYDIVYANGKAIESMITGVEVRYTVEHEGNSIDGAVAIDPDEYKRMKHDDIVEKARHSFNNTVQSIR